MEEGLTPLLNTPNWKKGLVPLLDTPNWKKGLDAPLGHPILEQGELKGGEASLIYLFPLPLGKGKGDKGGWG